MEFHSDPTEDLGWPDPIIRPLIEPLRFPSDSLVNFITAFVFVWPMPRSNIASSSSRCIVIVA
jgi:hypothetical protein